MVHNFIKPQHKAVAPIIATLLMVAIAVVGGILIFVFTQGFFADEQVVGPTVDNIRIYGYDAQDRGDLFMEAGFLPADDLACPGNTVAGDRLNASDCIVIFIENLGDKPVAIQSVRVFGDTYTLSSTSQSADCGTTAGTFSLHDNDSPFANLVIDVLEPNQRGDICITYSGNTGVVKEGRTIPIQIETMNGQSSQINVIHGALRGQIVS